MTLDDALAATVARAVAPLATELAAVRRELAAVRASMPPQMVSVAEYARRSGLSACTVRRHVADGTIPSTRIGGRVMCDLSSLRPIDPATVEALASEAMR
jgi:hypothetical protein